MKDKIAQLEMLVNQITQRLKTAEDQNDTLKNRVRTLESAVERLRDIETEVRALRDWKKDTIAQLKRAAAKLEKELK